MCSCPTVARLGGGPSLTCSSSKAHRRRSAATRFRRSAGGFSGWLAASAVAGGLLCTAGLVPLTAQAQTTLVSNTGQTASSAHNLGSGGSGAVGISHAFQTGSFSHSYVVREVVLNSHLVLFFGAYMSAEIQSGSSGDPSETTVAALTRPSALGSPSGIGDLAFPVSMSGGVMLDASTTYHVADFEFQN